MKSGIDYFPLDVTLDEKFELIEAEFGLTGFGVVVKLLQRIYGGQGYYVEWTNEVALLFAKRIGLGGSVVSEIVEASIKRGIFDKTLYDKYHILTSSGIQKRYFEAVGRRKSVEVEGRYLLVDATLFSKNVVIKGENVYIFGKNADISQQSREEESSLLSPARMVRRYRIFYPIIRTLSWIIAPYRLWTWTIRPFLVSFPQAHGFGSRSTTFHGWQETPLQSFGDGIGTDAGRAGMTPFFPSFMRNTTRRKN